MKKLLESVQTIIYMLMCILFSMLIYVYAANMIKRTTSYWLMAIVIISVSVIVDFFSRKYISNFLIFSVIHVIIVALAVVIPANNVDKGILGVITFAYLLSAYGFWRTDANERTKYVIDMPLELLMFYVAIYIHATSSKSISNEVASYAYISGIVFMLLFFMRGYIDKFLSFTLTSGDFTKEMANTFSTNFSLILFFNFFIIIGLMIVNLFVGDANFSFIGRFIKFLARKVFGHFASKPEAGPIPENTTSMEIKHIVSEQETTTEAVTQAVSRGGEAVENIYEVIVVIVLAVAIIALLVLAYQFVKQYLHRHNMTGDIVEKVEYQNVREKADPIEREERQTLFGSNKRKIRKLYTDYIKGIKKKYKKVVVKDSYTTDEIAISFIYNRYVDRANMEELTQVYKLARYSDHEITKKDVETAKNAIKS